MHTLNDLSKWQYLSINIDCKKKKKKSPKRADRTARLKDSGFSSSFEFSFELSFPVLVHFVGRFASTVWGSLGVTTRAQVHLVYLFERLVQVVLKRGHGSADGRRAKAVSDEAEMSQAALDSRLHDGGRPRVSQRWTVLSEQVSELLADLPESKNQGRFKKRAKYFNNIY